MSRSRPIFRRAMILAGLFLLATIGYATTLHAAEEIFSRSISIANETISGNAWSRSVATALAYEPGGVQANSRSVSLFNETSPLYATSRSVSIANGSLISSAYSKSVSLFNETTPSNAAARSVSVLNSPIVVLTDAISRGLKIWNDITGLNATSRQLSVRNDLTVPIDGGLCSTGTVVFRWPPTPGATTYRLQVATAANAQSIIQTTDVVADTSLVFSTGMSGGTYYARKSISFNGGQSFGDPSPFSDVSG